MTAPPHVRRDLIRDALDAVAYVSPRDLVRDVRYYLDDARQLELAIDVLVDGLIEDRTRLAIDEFEKIRLAMDACGRGRDDRVQWLEDHGLRPIPAPDDDEA